MSRFFYLRIWIGVNYYFYMRYGMQGAIMRTIACFTYPSLQRFDNVMKNTLSNFFMLSAPSYSI